MGTRVYVGNLPSDVLPKELEDIFSRYGKFSTVDLKGREGEPRFAFVEYEDPRDASEAVRAENGADFAGDRLRVRCGCHCWLHLCLCVRIAVLLHASSWASLSRQCCWHALATWTIQRAAQWHQEPGSWHQQAITKSMQVMVTVARCILTRSLPQHYPPSCPPSRRCTMSRA